MARTRHCYLAGGAVCAALLMTPGAAAQTGAAGGSASDAPAADGEILVTARKRAESLTDVPAAVTALTEADRENLVLDDVDDYLRQVPSATLVTSGPEYLNDISIRGQGGGRLGFSETATGIYRDGVFSAGGGFGGRSLSRMDLFDMERIEVLRGPQGALYGRNSVGGAINIISNRPEDVFGAQLLARYSDPQKIEVEGVVNLPLGDDAGLRVGGIYHDQNGGFITDVDTGETIDRQTYSGVRAALTAKPADWLRLDLRLEHYESEAPSFTSMGQRLTRVDGRPLDPSPYERAELSSPGLAKIDDTTIQFAADAELGFADLSLRFLHGARDGGRVGDDGDHFDGGTGIDVAPGAPVLFQDYSGSQFEDYRRTSAQLYLSSRSGDPVRWLIGAELLVSDSDVRTGPDSCPAYTGAALTQVAGCTVGAAGIFTPPAATPSLIANTVRTTGRLAMRRDDFTETLTSYSIFGSVEFPIVDRLVFGAELRAQFDRKDFDFERYSVDPLVYFGTGPVPAGMMAPLLVDPDGGGPLPAAPAQFCPPTLATPACAAGLETVRIEAERNWSFVTPAATLRWDVAPGQNLYLRFATGYRPGGFNTNLLSGATRAALSSMLLYEPEYAYSGEIGWKGSLFGGALKAEAALFYELTTDVQVATVASAAARGFLLVNAGDAHVYGFEAMVSRRQPIGAGELIASLNFSTQDGAFRKGALVPANGQIVDISGNEVPRLRDYQAALNLAYRHPVGGDADFFVSGSLQLADGGMQNPFGTESYAGYSLVDARIGVRTEKWRLSAFARNLTDERYLLNEIAGNAYWSQGRVIGLEAMVRY